MDLTSKKDIQNLLKQYETQPLERLGQNFLINKRAIKELIEAADLKKNDIILEIGPGTGVLTRELAKRVKKVIAVEKDSKMCQILKEMLDCWNLKNVEIVNEDILKLDTRYKIQDTRYKIVGNLPFYLTTPVIRQFLEAVETKPQQMVLVVQKEVGQRICACPPKLAERRRAKPLHLRQGYGGQSKMSILAVSVQFYAKPEIITFVSKKSFWPQPKVDSAILRINPLMATNRKLINTDLFFKIVKAGFSQPRKQLINNLSKGLKLERNEAESWLLKNNIRPSQRAETLSVEDWINLLQSCRIN